MASSLKSLNAPQVQTKENLFSHLPFCCLLAVLVLEKVRPQKHGLDISLKLIASLQCTLESCVPLVSVTCVQNLVVRVDTSLHIN